MKTRSFPFRTRPVWRVASPLLGVLAAAFSSLPAHGQSPAPQMVDPELAVRPVVSGLTTPISLAFLGRNDLLVLEKSTGQVKRIVNGTVHSVVLDLPVNSASERGLLGIALHPRFPRDPGVYLFWTESTTGADSTELADVPLLGNRVDRFVWNGSNLTYDRTLIRLRALQEDADQPPRGNHDGGVLRFGADRKLYIYFGDNGRRGQLQNLPDGPSSTGNQPDDQFGGPEPDDAHLTGVILRLNDDGSTPRDNPFYKAGALRGGEAGRNLQKVFAYGIRNGFGMAFDPKSGRLWEAQNGDDSFTEINLVRSGANLGWVQVMGPISRLAQFKAIETSPEFFGLQQVRWSPENIADSPEQALDRLFMIYEGGHRFGTMLVGAEENPPVSTSARALVAFHRRHDGAVLYELWALTPIQQVTAAHIHLGADAQNGPVVVTLYSAGTPQNFGARRLIARGTITDASITARPPFAATVDSLAERIRQGRTYVNVHTTANPAGEVRGQVRVIDRDPVSHYSDPEFSWKYEIAPAALGFVHGRALGRDYEGDLIVGAAIPVLEGGQLFRFNLASNRRALAFRDPRLRDRVADNTAKYDITESESLLFGTGFGSGTDIQSGPNGNLYVVSLTAGSIYEIHRAPKNGK